MGELRDNNISNDDSKMGSSNLTLNFENLSNDSINALCHTLSLIQSLKVFTFDGLTFAPEVADYLAAALQKNQSLETVTFTNLKLSNEDTDAFTKVIASATHIKHISMENNGFAADTVFCSYMSALQPNNKLNKFSYKGNNLGMRDVWSFFKALLQDRTAKFNLYIQDEPINSKQEINDDAIEWLNVTSSRLFDKCDLIHTLDFMRNSFPKFPLVFRLQMYAGMIVKLIKIEAGTNAEMQMLNECLRFFKDDRYATPFFHYIKNSIRPNKVSINQIVSQAYHTVKYAMPIEACNLIEDLNPNLQTTEPVINKLYADDEYKQKIERKTTTADWNALMWLLNNNHAPLKWMEYKVEKSKVWDYDLSDLDFNSCKKSIYECNPFLTKEMAPSTFTDREIVVINNAISATITGAGNCGEQCALVAINLCKYVSDNLTIYDDFHIELFNYADYFANLDHQSVRFRLNGQGMACDTWSNQFFMLTEKNKSFYMENFFGSNVDENMRQRLTRALFHQEFGTDPSANMNIKTLEKAAQIYKTFVQVLNSDRVKEMRGLIKHHDTNQEKLKKQAQKQVLTNTPKLRTVVESNYKRKKKLSLLQLIEQAFQAVKYEFAIGACNIIEDRKASDDIKRDLINKVYFMSEVHQRKNDTQRCLRNWKTLLWVLAYNYKELKWCVYEDDDGKSWYYDLSNLELDRYKKSHFEHNPYLSKENAPSQLSNKEIVTINFALSAIILRAGNCGDQASLFIVKLCKLIIDYLLPSDDFCIEMFNCLEFSDIDHSLVRFKLNGQAYACDTWSNRYFMLTPENEEYYKQNFFGENVDAPTREILARALFHEPFGNCPNTNIKITTFKQAMLIYKTFVKTLNSERVKFMRGFIEKYDTKQVQLKNQMQKELLSQKSEPKIKTKKKSCKII